MRQKVKQSVLRLLANHAVYRVMPPGGLRTYAALRYHGQRLSSAELARLVRSLGPLPTAPLPAAVLAAKAAFRTGQDDLLEPALQRLSARHPRSAPVSLLRSDLETFRGRYEEALRWAESAHDSGSGGAEATARIVKLSYRVRDQREADDLAVAAVGRYPLNHAVLWQAAVRCTTPAQFERLIAAWSASVSDETALVAVVRQLAVAAGRAGQVGEATRLYRTAVAMLTPSGANRRPPRTVLAGLGAGMAIEDLCQVLDAASVPYFFAAGTVLGLVREGQPLATDADIDVGIMEEHWDRAALISLFTRHPRFDLDLHAQSTKIGLRHRGGSPIDIFRFYREGDRVWHDGVFVRWYNTPFEVVRHPFRGGTAVPIPADTQRYLTENYGAGWQTPDPSFDAFVDAPNLEVTWPEYHVSHLWRRVYELTAAGDHRRADLVRQQVVQAPSPGSGGQRG